MSATITIPQELHQALLDQAARRQIGLEALVSEALTWYLQEEKELLGELSAWQNLRDEALHVTEEEPR
jgi:hypothetical protein